MNVLRRTAIGVLLFLAVLPLVVSLSGCADSYKSEIDSVQNSDDLNGFTVGCEEGAVYADDLQEIYPDSEVIENGTVVEAIQALKTGYIDAYITDEPLADRHIAQIKGLRKVEGKICDVWYGYLLNNTNFALCDEINNALAELRNDGTINTLYRKWIEEDADRSVNIPEKPAYPKGVLKIGYCPDAEPFCYLVGKEVVGYDVELAYMIAEKLNYEVELCYYDFSALLQSVSSNKVDMAIGCITYTPERAQTVMYTDSVYDTGAVAVVLSEKNTPGFIAGLKDSFTRTFITEQRWKLFLDGMLVTIELSALTLVFGTVAGFGFSFLLRSKNRFLSRLSGAISSLLDGLPLLIIIMVSYYIIFAKTTLPAVIIGVIGLSVDFANSVAGILNAGIAMVDDGQTEAAKSIGYSEPKAFIRIVLPQAVNRMFSQYIGSVIAMIKGTSIMGYITVVDLTKAGDLVRTRTFEVFFPLIVTSAIYFLLIRLIVVLLNKLAKRLEPKNRKRRIRGVVMHD